MTTTVEVWERDNLSTPGGPSKVADLTEVWSRRFRVAKNNYGSCEVNIQLSDPEVDEVQPGRLLVFNRDGSRYGFVIGSRRIVAAHPGEGAERVLQVRARGMLQALNDGRVQPLMGDLWQPWDRQIRWDWTNPELPTSGWSSAVELWRQGVPGDPAATSSNEITISADQGRLPWNAPDGFVDGNAWWIWSSGLQGSGGTGGSGTYHMPVGISYFHRTFTVSDMVRARLIAGADNFHEVALDGVVLLPSETAASLSWARARARDVLLSPGTHTIRVKVENVSQPDPDGNIAALVLAIHQINAFTETPGTVLVRTNDNWLALDYPEDPPGFTVGRILLTMLEAMQAEGFLLDVDPTFTATQDSDSNAWPVVSDVVTQVGQPFGEVLLQLAQDHIDFRANPDMTLDVWVKGSHGAASGVTYAIGVNITEAEFSGDSVPVSSMLVVHQEGIEVIGDATSGRQEMVDLSSIPRDQAIDRATSMLADLASEQWAVSFGVEPAGGDVPFDDVNVLDTAAVPNPAGSSSTVECIAISWTEDEAGHEILIPEFGDVVLTPEEREQHLIRREALGGLGGRMVVPPSTPGGVALAMPAGQGGGGFPVTAVPRSQVFERDASVTDSTSPAWPVDVSGNLFEVGVLLGEAQGIDVELDVIVSGSTAATVTVPAGKTQWTEGGLGVLLDKDADTIAVSCSSTGFYLQVTVRIS